MEQTKVLGRTLLLRGHDLRHGEDEMLQFEHCGIVKVDVYARDAFGMSQTEDGHDGQKTSVARLAQAVDLKCSDTEMTSVRRVIELHVIFIQ